MDLAAAAVELDEEVLKATSTLRQALGVYGIGAAFVLGVVELANNILVLIPGLGKAVGAHERAQFTLRVAGLDHADLFVASTALLALVAAINIGVAVMPDAGAVWHPGTDMRRRARLVVWTRCLSLGVGIAALLSSLTAVLAWTGDELRKNWLNAAFVTLLGALSAFLAANVTALANDDAELLLGIKHAEERRALLTQGLEALSKRWDKKDLAAPVDRRWLAHLLVGATVTALLFAAVVMVMELATGRFGVWATAGRALASGALLVSGAAVTTLVPVMLARIGLAADLRKNRIGTRRQHAPAAWVFYGGAFLLYFGLLGIALVGAAVQVGNPRSSAFLAVVVLVVVWWAVPVWTVVRGSLRGRGPVSGMFRATALDATQDHRSLGRRIDEMQTRLRAAADQEPSDARTAAID